MVFSSDVNCWSPQWKGRIEHHTQKKMIWSLNFGICKTKKVLSHLFIIIIVVVIVTAIITTIIIIIIIIRGKEMVSIQPCFC